MIEAYLHMIPRVDPTAFVHEGAYVLGDVSLGARVSIWPTTVLRGDQGAIVVGDDSNIQDGSVVHATGGVSLTNVGARVTVGHRAILHGCTVGDDCLVGMGSIVLDNAVIERNCIVGAGALVPVGMRVPEGSLVLGTPARVVRKLTEKDYDRIATGTTTYVRLAAEYLAARATSAAPRPEKRCSR